ncbi:MAG: hypothetical protein QW795_03580 [Candidatus Bathyarchaeia archaeon]
MKKYKRWGRIKEKIRKKERKVVTLRQGGIYIDRTNPKINANLLLKSSEEEYFGWMEEIIMEVNVFLVSGDCRFPGGDLIVVEL